MDILFPDLSARRKQKLLKKAKQLDIWNIQNNIFKPIILNYFICRKGCKHYCSEHINDFG